MDRPITTDVSDGDEGKARNADNWPSGSEAMTSAQASYLKTLCDEAGEAFDDSLSRAEAAKRIDALEVKTGRSRAAGKRPGPPASA